MTLVHMTEWEVSGQDLSVALIVKDAREKIKNKVSFMNCSAPPH